MPEYDLGKLIVKDHESETLTGAFGLPEGDFDKIVEVEQTSSTFHNVLK